MPGASFLLGKALDALMLDHIEHDLEELRLVNEILSDAYEAGGIDFPSRMQAIAASHGRPPRRKIQTFVIHPSMDIGLLASQHLRNHRPRLSRLLGHTACPVRLLGQKSMHEREL